ncbi:MAG: flagellar basal body rod C-terminal domain-containing protein [Planctomycetota bacterium]
MVLKWMLRLCKSACFRIRKDWRPSAAAHLCRPPTPVSRLHRLLSNVDIATEFVNLMVAQNGYQANARTITVANDILRELTNLIR